MHENEKKKTKPDILIKAPSAPPPCLSPKFRVHKGNISLALYPAAGIVIIIPKKQQLTTKYLTFVMNLGITHTRAIN